MLANGSPPFELQVPELCTQPGCRIEWHYRVSQEGSLDRPSGRSDHAPGYPPHNTGRTLPAECSGAGRLPGPVSLYVCWQSSCSGGPPLLDFTQRPEFGSGGSQGQSTSPDPKGNPGGLPGEAIPILIRPSWPSEPRSGRRRSSGRHWASSAFLRVVEAAAGTNRALRRPNVHSDHAHLSGNRCSTVAFGEPASAGKAEVLPVWTTRRRIWTHR